MRSKCIIKLTNVMILVFMVFSCGCGESKKSIKCRDALAGVVIDFYSVTKSNIFGDTRIDNEMVVEDAFKTYDYRLDRLKFVANKLQDIQLVEKYYRVGSILRRSIEEETILTKTKREYLLQCCLYREARIEIANYYYMNYGVHNNQVSLTSEKMRSSAKQINDLRQSMPENGTKCSNYADTLRALAISQLLMQDPGNLKFEIYTTKGISLITGSKDPISLSR